MKPLFPVGVVLMGVVTWRIIPGIVSVVIGSPPMYKPWSSVIWKGSHNPILKGDLLINHGSKTITGMILQAPLSFVEGIKPHKDPWDWYIYLPASSIRDLLVPHMEVT